MSKTSQTPFWSLIDTRNGTHRLLPIHLANEFQPGDKSGEIESWQKQRRCRKYKLLHEHTVLLRIRFPKSADDGNI